MSMQDIIVRYRAITAAAASALANERFFYVVIGLFVLQAVWFALTAKYPMAFDENFHFGLIQLHANQWLPFFTEQPRHAEMYGPVVRDPSYLYHFLLSVPYRLIRFVTDNQTAQIIALRILNIALFACSFVLIRRLLVLLGGSRALNHVVLLLFSLVPIVPFLAAHINYDNLFILMMLWIFLELFAWFIELDAHKISGGRTALLVSGLLLSCLIKYSFLPVALAVGGMMLWQLWQKRAYKRTLWSRAVSSLRTMQKWRLAAVVICLILSMGLFGERYGINIVRYHAPNPDCAQVLSVASCHQYGPWERDYVYVQTGYVANKLDYPWQWLYGMWQRSFFAISDTYDTKAPLPVPGGTAIALAVIGCTLFIWYSRRIIEHYVYRQTVLLAAGLYIAALFIQTYQGFVKTGIPVAINGRYLIPFLPFIMLFVGLAFRKLWHVQQGTKVLAVLIVTLLFLQGGGVLTFIVKSDDTWDWPNDAVIRINHAARNVLRTVIIGGRD